MSAPRTTSTHLPRLSTPSSAITKDLIAQVRFSPRAALLKQAENAEALTAEIDISRTYPEDWLTFRVTGYSPDLAAPRLIDGTSLLADLSSLVENLTSLAQLTAGEPRAAGEAVESLMARWRVTRRTIERYRRAGLVARRVIDDSARGRVRLVFSARAVETFENRWSMLEEQDAADAELSRVARPVFARRVHGTKRLSDAERREIVASGSEHHAATGASLDASAAHLARATGRAKSTVRRALQRAAVSPAATVGAPIPRRAPRDAAQDARLALRAQRAGIAIPRIADRLGRTVPTVHRLIAVARYEALTDLMPEADHHLDFATAETPRLEILMLDAEPCGVAELMNPAGTDSKPLSAQDERVLAVARAALFQQARRALANADRVSPTASAVDAAEAALCHALRLKRLLLRSTLPLIRRTLRQHAEAAGSDAVLRDAALHERCLAAASDAIDDFIPVGTGRLAARVSLALTRALNTKATAVRRAEVPREAPLGATPAHLTMPPWVRRGLLGLSEKERVLVVARFGTANEPPRSLSSLVDSNPSLTPAAWWAMYRKAAKHASLL